MRVTAGKCFTAVCCLSALISCALPITSWSAGKYCPVKSTWFMDLGAGGASLTMPGSTNVLNGAVVSPPMNQDRFSIDNASGTMTQFGIGYRWYQDKNLLPYTSLSFQYRHYMNANIQGTIDQYSLPGFVNYNYQVRYGADMFLLNTKVDLIERRKIMPYVSGSLGVSLTHMNDYTETPTVGVTARDTPGYKGNTIKRLAVTVGAGIDYILTDNIWVTLGYDHVFQSDLKTGPGVGSWSDSALFIGNPRMDTVFVAMSASIPGALRR